MIDKDDPFRISSTCYSSGLVDVSIHVVAQQIRDFTFVAMFCFVDMKSDLETSNPSHQKRIIRFPCSGDSCVKNVSQSFFFTVPTQSLTYKGQHICGLQTATKFSTSQTLLISNKYTKILYTCTKLYHFPSLSDLL